MSVTTRTIRQLRVLYSSPVTNCVRRLRVFPPPVRGAQRVRDLQWSCAPEPDEAKEYSDEFGNCILEVAHRRVASSFSFHMSLWTERDDAITAPELNLPPSGRGAFLLPSRLCEHNSFVERQAALLRAQQRTGLEDICDFVYRSLEYSVGQTDTSTTGSQAMARGGGVCQDYSHLMIAFCRALGIAARYVSGYNPAEGRMHSWVEALQNNVWEAWDPTHNRRTRLDCVFVACGRDFRDVAPHEGTYCGRADARLESLCKTKVVQ